MRRNDRDDGSRLKPVPPGVRSRSFGTVESSASCSPLSAARITGIRPDVTGIFVRFKCAACDVESEHYQPTIAGFAAGTHTCARCAAVHEVEQKDLVRALDGYRPHRSPEAMIALTAEATRIAETWHDVPELAAALTHAEVRLAPAMERELLAFIIAGLLEVSSTGEVE